MSEIESRPRRADAERSIAAVLDAAIRVLGERPDASMTEIATAAGVTRQTVYAHYPSRKALLNAVLDRLTAEAVAAIEAADLGTGSATDALLRFVDASWRTIERFPLLLRLPADLADGPADADRHAPIVSGLERLIRRGHRTGEFDRAAPAPWLIAATIALGHTAGEQVAAGHLTVAEATAHFKRSVLRLYTPGPEPSAP